MEREIEIGKIYKHFKGHVIKVVAFAEHTETNEKMVIYINQDTNKTWARPYDMFNSLVDKHKYPGVNQKYRFEEFNE